MSVSHGVVSRTEVTSYAHGSTDLLGGWVATGAEGDAKAEEVSAPDFGSGQQCC